MSKFPAGSVRAAVAQHGDDWIYSDKRVRVPALEDHFADMDVVSLCAAPYWKGGDHDPRVWSGVSPAERVRA